MTSTLSYSQVGHGRERAGAARSAERLNEAAALWFRWSHPPVAEHHGRSERGGGGGMVAKVDQGRRGALDGSSLEQLDVVHLPTVHGQHCDIVVKRQRLTRPFAKPAERRERTGPMRPKTSNRSSVRVPSGRWLTWDAPQTRGVQRTLAAVRARCALSRPNELGGRRTRRCRDVAAMVAQGAGVARRCAGQASEVSTSCVGLAVAAATFRGKDGA